MKNTPRKNDVKKLKKSIRVAVIVAKYAETVVLKSNNIQIKKKRNNIF